MSLKLDNVDYDGTYMITKRMCIKIKMNAAEIETQILQNTKGLPADALQEILHFVQFIRERRLKFSLDDLSMKLSVLDKSEAKHLEEEFKNYKELYPKNE